MVGSVSRTKAVEQELNPTAGLGLALVAKVIADHGGVVECESQPRRTLFRVLLPVAANLKQRADLNEVVHA